MLIRELIQNRLNSSINIFNREGLAIPESQIKSEYQAIRQYLLDFHSEAHNCVAIKQHKDYRYFLTMLACMEIGIPYIPMKYDYPMDRVEQIKEASNFTILIDDEKVKELLNYKNKVNFKLPEISPERNMYIIFTSGSTGRPKGVIIQRQALGNFFEFMDKTFTKVTDKDRLLQVTEFTFDISLVDVAFFLTKNVDMHFSNFDNNIFKLGFEIETHRISVLNTVPNNLNMFLSELVAERMDYQCLKHLYIGGARYSYGLYQKCLKYFRPDVEIYNFYGPTEATVYCHVKKITYNESIDCVEGNVSIGGTLPGVDAHIVIDGQIAPANEKGELYIGGIQLMREYINNPEQTSKALVDFSGKTYYRSGDLSFRNEKNEFFIVGRADDTIKYRGFRINLLDIDSYVTRIPYIQDSVTVAIPNEATENQTLGFIILKEQKTIKEIKKDLAVLLLDYQIPEKIIFVDKYPTNIAGKVCKNTLKAQYLESLNKVKND
jgi:acyl-coenzyme A synthetase/AMP-(fatty) acid ligase